MFIYTFNTKQLNNNKKIKIKKARKREWPQKWINKFIAGKFKQTSHVKPWNPESRTGRHSRWCPDVWSFAHCDYLHRGTRENHGRLLMHCVSKPFQAVRRLWSNWAYKQLPHWECFKVKTGPSSGEAFCGAIKKWCGLYGSAPVSRHNLGSARVHRARKLLDRFTPERHNTHVT